MGIESERIGEVGDGDVPSDAVLPSVPSSSLGINPTIRSSNSSDTFLTINCESAIKTVNLLSVDSSSAASSEGLGVPGRVPPGEAIGVW
jgi:hypothetical protein